MSLLSGLFGPPTGAGAGRGTAAIGGGDGNASYSFARLQHLYSRLALFRESDLDKGGGGDEVVETVRQITEALIWGEQNGEKNDNQFFDFFCEKNILADFVRVLGLQKAPKKVKLQLLQTLSMLVLNIKCKTSVYYLLSNNHINRLIKTDLDFEDEELLAYYISLIKSLAMRLDSQTIKFFFLQHPEPTFPLYIESTKFFNHRDQMVRTSVRSITLQVYSIDDQLVRRFVLRHAAESYFKELAYHLRDLWSRLDVEASNARDFEALKPTQREHELQKDLLIYLSDMFEQQVEELNEVLADRLLHCAMLPMLLTGITAGDEMDLDEPTHILMPAVALFLIRQVFDTFRCPCLLVPLASALVERRVPVALAFVLPQCPELGTVSPPAHLQQDLLPNALRAHFLECLESTSDAVFLLAAGVVHGCLQHADCLWPALRKQLAPAAAGRAAEADARLPTDSYIEVCHTLLQATSRYASWQLDTLEVLARVLLDMFLRPEMILHPVVCVDLRQVVRSAVQRAAEAFHDVVAKCSALGESGNWILDVFAEEWMEHKAPRVDVAQFCGDPMRLLPPPLWGSSAAQRGPSRSRSPDACEEVPGEARNAARRFLVLRRLLADFEQHAPEAAHAELLRSGCPWARASEQPNPVAVEVANAFHEGTTLDLGAFEQIVCGVAGPKGKCTRYLLLHDYWFMLVQPDVALPGQGTVKTLWPLWQVHSLVDRGDPRTLQIFLKDASAVSPSKPALEDRAAGTPIVLNFKDVGRCHSAQGHIERQRQSIRLELMQKLAEFVAETRAEVARAASM